MDIRWFRYLVAGYYQGWEVKKIYESHSGLRPRENGDQVGQWQIKVNLHRQESVASLGTRLLTSTQSSRAFGSLYTTRQESGVLYGRKEV